MFVWKLNIGYFKSNESIFYKCINNYDKFSNIESCEKCENNYDLVGNNEKDTLKCLPENELNIGYYKENNSISRFTWVKEFFKRYIFWLLWRPMQSDPQKKIKDNIKGSICVYDIEDKIIEEIKKNYWSNGVLIIFY